MNPAATFAVLLSFAALAGCASQPKEPPPKPFAGTRWQVQLEVPLAGEQPNMRFGDGRVEGFGGCNKFAAPYVQDSGGARAIGTATTKRDRRRARGGPKGGGERLL